MAFAVRAPVLVPMWRLNHRPRWLSQKSEDLPHQPGNLQIGKCAGEKAAMFGDAPRKFGCDFRETHNERIEEVVSPSPARRMRL